jgi:hypothetical protein
LLSRYNRETDCRNLGSKTAFPEVLDRHFQTFFPVANQKPIFFYPKKIEKSVFFLQCRQVEIQYSSKPRASQSEEETKTLQGIMSDGYIQKIENL